MHANLNRQRQRQIYTKRTIYIVHILFCSASRVKKVSTLQKSPKNRKKIQIENERKKSDVKFLLRRILGRFEGRWFSYCLFPFPLSIATIFNICII